VLNSGNYFLQAIHFLVAWWGGGGPTVCAFFLERGAAFGEKIDEGGWGVNFK